MAKGLKTGNNTSKSIAPIFFEQINKLNNQTYNLKIMVEDIQNQREKIKLTAQEIIDSCCEKI